MFHSQVKRKLVSSFALTIALTSPAYAQGDIADNPEENGADTPAAIAADSLLPGETANEIVVTGSRIEGVAPVGSVVISVDRSDIEQSTAQTTAQLLQQVPQILDLGVSEASRGQSGGSANNTYGSSINIRGIGPYTTLTLINGHRVVPQGTSGYAVDPNIIPTLALERIEVVADGASAIYGSDAIAGVANLILRRNFEGLEVSGTYGFASDYTERQIGMIAGHSWSTGQFTLAAQYDDHSNLNGNDREFYTSDLRSRGGSDFRSNQCDPGTITLDGTDYAIPTGGVTAANRDSLVAGTSNLCETLEGQDLLPRIRRKSAALTFDQDITENLSIYGDAFVAHRKFRRFDAIDTSSLTVPATNAFFVAPPGTSPTSEIVHYSFGKDFQRRPSSGSTKTYSGTIGARLKLPHSWKLEGDLTYGYSKDKGFSQGTLNSAALKTVLANSDPSAAFNPFGGPNSTAVIDSILVGHGYADGSTKFTFWQTSANGSLIDLPGGALRAVIGYEGQHAVVDQTYVTGTISAPVVAVGNPKHATRTVNSGYVEVYLPIFDSPNARQGLEKLEIDVALRYDSYSDAGHTTNPKIGINYSPVDGLLLRGSYGTSFRAPGIAQLYGNTNTLYVRRYSDPTIGSALSTGIVRTGGNLDLTPETATTFSFGAELQPLAIPGLRLSANYFSIDYNNQITTYRTDFTVLQRENDFVGTGLITRNPTAEEVARQVAETSYTGVLPADIDFLIDGRDLNLGRSIARGIDFSASYRMPTDNAGVFNFKLDGTYFLKYKVAVSAIAPLTDELNTIFNPLRFRARASLDWFKGPFDAAASLQFNNGYHIVSPVPPTKVSAQALLNLHVGIDLGEIADNDFIQGLRLGVDVRNALDSHPPFVNIAPNSYGGGGFDPTVGSPVGRLVALSISKKF